MNQAREFCDLTNLLGFLKAHHCFLGASPLLKFSPLTAASQKRTNFTALETFCNTWLQSVLACTVSSGLLGCSVAPCVGHVSHSPPPPRSLLLLPPRSATPAYTWLYKLSILFATRSGVSHMTCIGSVSATSQRFFSQMKNLMTKREQDSELQMINNATGKSRMSYGSFLVSFIFQLLSVSFRFFTKRWIRWIWSYQHSHVLRPLHFRYRKKALLRPSTNVNLCYS